MKGIYFIAITIALCFSSCEKDDDDEYNCSSGDPKIVGATCNDGSRSNATGQGACSSHGGVAHWICKN